MSRLIRMPLQAPVGRRRGTSRQEIPPSVRATVRQQSDIGTEANHLWPLTRYASPGPRRPTGRATVTLARRSEPPCFSVMK